MLREIIEESEKLEEREKFAKKLSSLIFPLWIILLLFSSFLYSMSGKIEALQDTYKLRSALEEIITFMNYQIISVILGGILGVMIFLSIILAERPSNLNKLGGIMFGISSVFDGFMAYELYNVKLLYQEILQKFVLLTPEMMNNYMDMVQKHFSTIMTYNRLSAIFVGLAFVFFGVDSVRYSRRIRESLPKGYPIGIVVQAEYEMTKAINKIKSGASKLEWSGVLFLISGVLDIMFGILLAGEFANIAFIMFLMGLFLESMGIREIREGATKLAPFMQTVSLKPEESEGEHGGIVSY